MPRNPSSNSFDDLKRKMFERIRPECEGAIALFQDKPVAYCVRVSDIRVDDWGVRLTITYLPMEGTRRSEDPNRQSSDISCTWSVFSPDSSEWYARYGWRLFFDSELIEDVKALGIKLAKEGKLLDYDLAQMCVLEHRARKQAAEINPRTRT